MLLSENKKRADVQCEKKSKIQVTEIRKWKVQGKKNTKKKYKSVDKTRGLENRRRGRLVGKHDQPEVDNRRTNRE